MWGWEESLQLRSSWEGNREFMYGRVQSCKADQRAIGDSVIKRVEPALEGGCRARDRPEKCCGGHSSVLPSLCEQLC